ncbi:MAG TPA: hypothetical protein VF832_08050, partial [Longimicrobiales bacterium]
IFLLVARRLSPGEKVLVALAGLTLLGNAFYWHHGLFMGPRMLNEVAFVWALLAAAAAVGLLRRLPAELNAHGDRSLAVRGGVGIALGLCLLFAVLDLAPTRLLRYDDRYAAIGKMPVPRVSGPALIFVHDAFPARLATRLSGAGMQLDSVETALRQNDACRLEHFVDAYTSRPRPPLPPVDFAPRAQGFPRRVEIVKGDYVLMSESSPWTPDCVRELRSDRFGVLDITPLLWQTDLPGERPRGPLVVRDLGPAANAALIRAHPDRQPLVYMTPADDNPPVLLPYAQGMTLLWGKGGQP